ncbi:hypothetical protein [Streptomyces sp. NPDC006879]|uniref:hypothetical protein n=1 Tax=Streptomyces sp. NPDC006879 TaxID=3364767 RepID=UPI0036A3551A
MAPHRITTGLNARAVLERLGPDGIAAEICHGLLDEFHDWVEDVTADPMRQRDAIRAEHQRITKSVLEGGRVRSTPCLPAARRCGPLLLLLDGRDPSAQILHTLRPEADVRPVNTTEDRS